MDLRWLEDLLVLLEEGNLSRAARRRAVTQPAFSRRIRAVEHWLGQDILDRKSNRVEIRDALRGNESEIRALVRRLSELQRRVRHADTAGRTVTLTTQHALAETLASDFILLARRRIGQVDFRLRTADRSECISIFVRGDADLLICYVAPGDPSLMFDESFARAVLGQDRLMPVLDRPLDQVPDPDALPMIAYPESSYLGQVLSRAYQAGEVRLPKGPPICDTEFSAAARDMAIRGLGLAWVPASLARHDLDSGRLVDLGGVFGHAGLGITLFARPGGLFDAAMLKTLALTIGQLPEFAGPLSADPRI